MSYTLLFKPSAKREFDRLERGVQKRISQALTRIAEDPHLRGSKQLKDSDGALRVRVGDYRIVYEVWEEKIVVLVLRIGHRREVYR
jgi:mRNA interferase RelE/StbE